MDDLRLYAVVLRLRATQRGALSADHGDQARAALFDVIERGDLALAQTLHDANAHKPYTISLLRGGKRGADGAQHFGEGDTADWRFTLLCEPAFEALLKRYLLNRNLPHVRVGAVQFAIADAYASGMSHADSGYVTLADLQRRWAVSQNQPPCTFILDFLSPTGFNLGQNKATGERRWCALPEPRLIFSALRKKWVHLGGSDPGDGFDTWVAAHVEAEPLRIETRRTVIERRPVSGFVGQVRFRLRGDGRWWPLVHLLAELSFWTGVGYQTTRGMGQVRKKDD